MLDLASMSISLNTFHCHIFIPPKVQPIVHAIGGGNSTLSYRLIL